MPLGDAVRDDVTSRPRFDLVMRGYDKRQVDQYAAKADHEIATLTAEYDRARNQLQVVSVHLQQVQAELTELRHKPVPVNRASFRDLGPMVDQILALAEKQAAQI